MHIPDGYLSPTTCVALYSAATPFWYVALKKVKSRLHTRLVPRLALFAAFSFVLMMFNIPLPGGTSGHATGVGLATLVLGPWAGMLAISTALLIQALFFGDGGITAFGANAFNMAIVGCLVTYAVYRFLRIFLGPREWARPIAAGLAAYVAINISALFTAVEFGIQPLLFKDSLGHPLYAPFSLSVAVPAMLIGHLTFAGITELLVTTGVVAYLQRTSPGLLADKTTAAFSWKPAWLALALLVIMTPLGLLTAGHAWGEWSASDFQNPAARATIEKASGGASAPVLPPAGLQRFSNLWNAPLRDYSTRFIPNSSAGYIFSAISGVALLMLLVFCFGALFGRRHRRPGAETSV